MKKKLTLGALSLVLACSVGLGCKTALPTAADDTSVQTSVEGTDSVVPTEQKWTNIAGDSTTAVQEDGITLISGLNTWGTRQAFAEKQALDGLTVRFSIREGDINSGDVVGFQLVNDLENGYYNENTALAFSLKKSAYSGQSRLQAGPNHDFNQPSLVYIDETFAKAGFGAATSMVLNDVGSYDLTINFSKTESGNWRIMISDNIGGTVWTNNANFKNNTVTVYAKAETFGKYLDENGKIGVLASGFVSGTNPGINAGYRIGTYENMLMPAASEALEAYKRAVNAIVDEETYNASIAVRTEFIEAITMLKVADAAIYNASLAETDALAAEKAQEFVKAAVQKGFDMAKEAADALAEENSVTQALIDAATASLNEAVAIQQSYSSMLSEENSKYFDGLAEEYGYAIDKATAVLWTKEFEGQVASIETFEVSEIMAKINAVKDVYDSLADSTVQNCIDGLNETDKAEIQKRIAAAKAELDSLDEKYGALSAIEVDVGGKPAGEWTAVTGLIDTTLKDKDTVEINGLNTYGARACYDNKVKLDGLSVTIGVSGWTSVTGDCLGFLFGKTNTAFWTEDGTTAAAFTLWNQPYGPESGQLRLQVGPSHNYSETSLAFTNDKFETPGFGIAGSMVLNRVDSVSLTISFEQMENGNWKVVISDNLRNAMWNSNANYNDYTCTVYMKADTFADYLDEEGKVWLLAHGFPSGGNPPVKMSISVVDSSDPYYQNELAAADTKLNEYIEAALAIDDEASYDAAMEAREAFIAAIGKLRANNATYYTAALEAYDILIVLDEDAQAIVKAKLSAIIGEEAGKITALETEANVTAETLAAGKEALQAAKEAYEVYFARLSENNRKEFEELLDGYSYTAAKAEVALWILDYEKGVAALENMSAEELPDAIRNLTDIYDAFANSSAYEILQTLKDGDKAAYEKRIADAKADCDTAKENNDEKMKEYFVNLLAEAVSEDLTQKENIVSAIDTLAYVNENVTITEADDIYNLYMEKVQAIYDAGEEWILSEIESVTELLKEDYTTLGAFQPVKTRYESIDMGLIFEENGNKESIQAEYDALTELIEKEAMYWLSANEVNVLEQNATGIYTEMTPKFPNRLNYLKKLDATEGIEVSVELTEAAFYNDNSLANNLCFNFLLEPGKHKAEADGISIVIWLYPTESNVQIFNYSDKVLGQFSVSTPIEGGTFDIKVFYGDYYDFTEDKTIVCWQITVNGQMYTLSDELLTSEGHDIGTDLYFSFGSFADKTDKPNCLTLISVNDFNFGYVPKEDPEAPTEPEDPEKPDDSTDSTDSTDSAKPEDSGDGKTGGCGSIISAGIIGGSALAAAAVVFTRRKKRG